MSKHKVRGASAGLAVLCLIPVASLAAEVGGGISVGASYTDNLFLGPPSNDFDEVAYQVTPNLTFTHSSAQVDVTAEYAFDWYRYADLGATSKYHRGDVTVSARAWEDSLTTEFGARRSQALGNPQDVIPAGRLPLSGNLVDEDEWWFNPQLSRSLGGSVALEAGYRFSKVQFDTPLAQDQTNHTGNFSLDNYSGGSGLAWALRYQWSRAEFEVSAPWEYQTAGAELGVWVNGNTRIFGAGGKESSFDNPFDPAMEDSYWEAGFAYSPSENLSAEFAAGERSFGSSWRGSLDHTFRRGSLTLGYDESPTTTGFNRPGGLPNTLDPREIDDFLDRPGSAERFVSSRFTGTLNLEFRRSNFALTVFDEDRSDRFSADGLAIGSQSQTGVRALFAWQAGVRTSLSFFGTLIDQKTGAGDESEFASTGFSVDYQIGSRTSASIAYDYDEQQPKNVNSGGRDYTANTISLFFTYSMQGE